MKTCNVAALALSGWYLIVPPVGGDASAPLSQWRTIDRFDTAQECRRIERFMADAIGTDDSPPHGTIVHAFGR